MPRFKSLAWRIYFAFLVAAVIPTGLAGTIGVYLSLDTLRRETADSLAREVGIRAQGIGRFFDQISAELLLLAESRTLAGFGAALRERADPLAQAARAALEDDYAALARLSPYVYQLRYLDASGRERIRVERVGESVRVTPEAELQDKSDRYYFAEAMARGLGAVYVSPLDLNIEHGVPERPERPVIRLATPVGPAGAAPEGLLIINLHAEVLLGQIQEMADSRAGEAFLFDRAGQYVARGAYAEGRMRGFEMRPVATLEGSFGGEALRRIVDGTSGVASSGGWSIARAPLAIGDDHWTLALAYPEHRLFDAVFNLYVLYTVLTVSLAVTAIGGFALSRRLLGPLELLSRETETIAAGDFSRRIRLPGNDEIAALAARFDAMTGRLQALYASIEAQRDRLEVEVRAQTRDLERERAFLFALVEHLDEGVLVLAQDGTMRLANPIARRLLALPAALDGRPLADCWPDWAGISARLDPGGAPRDVTLAGRVVALSASRFEDGVILLLRDVTEERHLADDRRELDRQMFQMERLVTFGELAMGLAHEIGNPLAGMKAVAQALQYEDDLPPGAREALRRLEGEVDRLAGFLRSFHGFAAQPAPAIVDCGVAQIVDDVLFWTRKEARQIGVSIETEGLEAAPALRADPQLLKQVLLNLLINALHAMAGGGRLLIRAAPGAGGRCELRVSDTGSGIAPELRARIFDPFFTTRRDGTGLGLAIVRNIVTAHGATIDVESRPGEGTSFILNWPASERDSHHA